MPIPFQLRFSKSLTRTLAKACTIAALLCSPVLAQPAPTPEKTPQIAPASAPLGIGAKPNASSPTSADIPAPANAASLASSQPRPTIDECSPTPLAAPQQRPADPPLPVQPTPQLLLEALQKQAAATSNDAALSLIGTQAAAIEATAQARVATCRSEVSATTDQLKRLMRHVHGAGTPIERHERFGLESRREKLLGEETRAQALVTYAGQTFSLVAERRRNEFSARFLERSPSPFSPEFWSGVEHSGQADLARLTTATQNAGAIAMDAREPRGALALSGGLLLLVLLLFPGRQVLEAWGRRKAVDPDGPGAFTRSSHALWLAAINTALPAIAGLCLHMATRWGGLLSTKADALAGAAVIALVWGAAILALGRALATEKRADQRLLDLPMSTAQRLKRGLWAVAFVTGAGFLLNRLNYVVGGSVAATMASNAAISIAYAAVAALILLSLRRDDPSDDTAHDALSHTAIWTLISLVLTAAIVAILGAVAFGYTTLAALISGQVFWLSVLAAAAFLLLRFIDELCTALFFGQGWAGRALARVFGVRRTTAEQIGVLLSAAFQLFILIGAATLALTPFGADGGVFISDLGRLGRPVHIGTATISPAAIATGLISLALGLVVVQVVRRWFVRRFLPVTDWDVGLRTSVSTGITYLGVGLTILCAFGAMGLGFQQIALVASALSVGIGFGLQNVVQNFVSGLILLIERPVKVGDWVHVADVEGDVRRIRVRATEIQLFDRSTVIVPNSDLITKSVQNKTLGDPRGRIQLQISIANPTDASKAHDLIKSLATDHPKVLADPGPSIFIDSLATGGAVNFNCYLYVSNPRDAYTVRSDLYFAVIDAFQKGGVAFIGAVEPQMMIMEPGPKLESLLKAELRDGEEPIAKRP